MLDVFSALCHLQLQAMQALRTAGLGDSWYSAAQNRASRYPNYGIYNAV